MCCTLMWRGRFMRVINFRQWGHASLPESGFQLYSSKINRLYVEQATQYTYRNFVQFFCRLWWYISTTPELWAPLLYHSIFRNHLRSKLFKPNYFSVLNIWWIVLWCSQRLKTLLKTFWQIIQVSGSSEPCWTLMCLDKLLRRIDLAQCGQLVITPATKDSVRIWPMRSWGKWMKDFPNKTLHIFFSNASFEDNNEEKIYCRNLFW